MLIRFFGLEKSFGFFQIGGTDSFFRRLGFELYEKGHQIEFIHYNCHQDAQSVIKHNFNIIEFRSFPDALTYLAKKPGPILVNAINKADRLAFIKFRWQMRKTLAFYMVYSFYAETRLGRFKHFLEAMLYPYKPGALCMSYRLTNYVNKLRNRADLLLPPVDTEYFYSPNNNKSLAQTKIVVAYIGRLEAGKGAPEAVAILEKLAKQPQFEVRVSGYAFTDTSEVQSLHHKLSQNHNIQYERLEHKSWNSRVEEHLTAVLQDIDVLLLPYQKISSSIDTPLLLLEGMAARCCCVSRPLGDIPKIYGDSPFLIDQDNFVSTVCQLLIQEGRVGIEKEKSRVAQRIRELAVDTPNITTQLINILHRDGVEALNGYY